MWVKNAVVRENFWDTKDFFRTREEDFIAATQVYPTSEGDITVIFKDRMACFLIDDVTDAPATREKFSQLLKQMYDQGSLESTLEDLFGEYFVLIGIKGVIVDEDALDSYGISDGQKQDIIARMKDLENYYVDTEEDAVFRS